MSYIGSIIASRTASLEDLSTAGSCSSLTTLSSPDESAGSNTSLNSDRKFEVHSKRDLFSRLSEPKDEPVEVHLTFSQYDEPPSETAVEFEADVGEANHFVRGREVHLVYSDYRISPSETDVEFDDDECISTMVQSTISSDSVLDKDSKTLLAEKMFLFTGEVLNGFYDTPETDVKTAKSASIGDSAAKVAPKTAVAAGEATDGPHNTPEKSTETAAKEAPGRIYEESENY
ncbi:hypothetical protein Tcan_14178 [Toxocara canis]|uniref:Uncharacterized protein n=1 Tax=Toxocara canis TaxID=6265 RepID=A0A0B2UW83_TOXCA|nr:hypothetical protein Tcan_14178 [Toxocara canis]